MVKVVGQPLAQRRVEGGDSCVSIQGSGAWDGYELLLDGREQVYVIRVVCIYGRDSGGVCNGACTCIIYMHINS